MHYLKFALGAVAGVALATSASAQTVGIGSTASGAVAQITAQMSKVISTHGEGLQMRSQTMGGTQQYIPVINAGELDFGIANIPQYNMAVTGTGLSEGTKYENLRLVSTMMLFRISLLIPAELDAKTMADMKGKRMPSGFKAAPLFDAFVQSVLATEGLTYDDVVQVPTVGLSQSWRAMMEGKVDGVIAALGTGFIQQMNASISGGVRYLSLRETPETLEAMNKHLPGLFFTTVQPGPTMHGVKEPTTMATYDFTFFTHKGVSDEVIYKVAKIMHQQAKDLKEGGALWNSYPEGAGIAKDHGTPYHPGAVKYYKEAGLLP